MNDASLVHTPRAQTSWLMCFAHFGTCFAWFLAPLAAWLYARYAELASRALAALLWSLLGTAVAAATCGLAVPVFLLVHLWAGLKELREERFDYPLASELAEQLGA